MPPPEIADPLPWAEVGNSTRVGMAKERMQESGVDTSVIGKMVDRALGRKPRVTPTWRYTARTGWRKVG